MHQICVLTVPVYYTAAAHLGRKKPADMMAEVTREQSSKIFLKIWKQLPHLLSSNYMGIFATIL